MAQTHRNGHGWRQQGLSLLLQPHKHCGGQAEEGLNGPDEDEQHDLRLRQAVDEPREQLGLVPGACGGVTEGVLQRGADYWPRNTFPRRHAALCPHHVESWNLRAKLCVREVEALEADREAAVHRRNQVVHLPVLEPHLLCHVAQLDDLCKLPRRHLGL